MAKKMPRTHNDNHNKKNDVDDTTEYKGPSIDIVLSIIGQKKRLEILRSLLDAETGSGVTYLAAELGVKAPTIEKHLNTLKNVGLVKKQLTLEFTRERWVIRGRKRIARLLSFIDSDIKDLVEPGGMLEEIERMVRRQQYYKEHESTLQEIEHTRKEGLRLDMLLERLAKDYDKFLDDDERKKLNYWISARNAGML